MSRFSAFFDPSVGDRLLHSATSVKLALHRWPAGDEPAECNFELSGTVALDRDDAAGLLQDLVREFNVPRPSRPEREEGGASC